MTTKSHYDLALYLLETIADLGSASANAAFVLGCVEPDINPVTYLKGSLSYRPLRGHNYPNTVPSVKALLKKLQHCEKAGLLHCYRLGKLLHYVTDAFTYPHNQSFTAGLREHVRYEQTTEEIFESVLSAREAMPVPHKIPNLYAFFSAKHEQYQKQTPDAKTDVRFVLDVVPSVFQSLYISVRMTHRREIKHRENSFNL